jgi:hypothetical protein
MTPDIFKQFAKEIKSKFPNECEVYYILTYMAKMGNMG